MTEQADYPGGEKQPPPEFASAGGKGGGGNNIAGARSQAGKEGEDDTPPSVPAKKTIRGDHFETVLDCLDRAVTRWVLIDSKGDETRYRSSNAASCQHLFPHSYAGSFYENRIAMVVLLTCPGLKKDSQTLCYLLEIDTAPNEGFKALLFRPGALTLGQAIHQLLAYAADHRGVWPDYPPSELQALSYYAPFKHFFEVGKVNAKGATPLKPLTYLKPMEVLTSRDHWRARGYG